jgi:hypothetical protein
MALLPSRSPAPLNFEQLRLRVLAAIRHKINNGELTERGLARLSRLSQPCVHNVLKGERPGSMETLDRLLKATRLDLQHLIQSEHESQPASERSAARHGLGIDSWRAPEACRNHASARRQGPSCHSPR